MAGQGTRQPGEAWRASPSAQEGGGSPEGVAGCCHRRALGPECPPSARRPDEAKPSEPAILDAGRLRMPSRNVWPLANVSVG